MITIIQENPIPSFSAAGAEFDSQVLIDKATGQSGAIPIDVKIIPDSFWEGLADCDAGRVVDMDRAMNEPPPEAD